MSDLISRQAAIDALHMHLMYRMGTDSNKRRLDDWINSLPSAQPEKRTEKRTETHACDLIDRQAAIDALDGNIIVTSRESAQAVMDYIRECADRIRSLPSAQPEDCDTCKHGYFRDNHCETCRMRFPSHYERRTDEGD